MPKFEINNPEALKLIADFKSGVLLAPYIAKLKQYRIYIISVCLFLIFLIFVSLGKNLYRGSTKTIFLPPKLDDLKTTETIATKSEFETIRQEILNFSTELPDPIIPPFDNNINLELDQTQIQVW